VVASEARGTTSVIIGGVVDKDGEPVWGFFVKITSRTSQTPYLRT
jgi:hypothetical protein